MAKKNRFKTPPIAEGKFNQPSTPKVSTNAHKPLFSLEYLDNGHHSLAACDQREKAALSDTLAKLSRLTWGQMGSAPRHGNGHEIILQSQINASIPDHITGEMRLLAFRFCGKAPMVGYREDRIFHIVWLDRSFSLYNHG